MDGELIWSPKNDKLVIHCFKIGYPHYGHVWLICNIFCIILESQSWTKGSFWEHVFISNSDKLRKLGVCWIDKVPSLVWDYRKSDRLGKLFLKLMKQSIESVMKWDLIKDSGISYILVWSLVLLLDAFIIFSQIGIPTIGN